MSTIVSRVGYCPACAKNGSPKTNEPFLVIGSTSNEYILLYALHNGRNGFVPTFYRLYKVVDDKVYFQKLCGVCGFYSYVKNRKRFVTLIEDNWSGLFKTSLTNWNALILYKHDEMFWI